MTPGPDDAHPVVSEYRFGERERAAWDAQLRLLFTYSVIFTLRRQVAGSGTLVSIGERRGILTAAHVYDLLRKADFNEVTLLARQDEHVFEIGEGVLEPVFRERNERDEHAGPDLAFLEIVAPTLLAEMDRSKSFYPLARRRLSDFGPATIEQLNWVLSGAPGELAVTYERGGPQRTVLHADQYLKVLPPGATLLEERGEFDFLVMEVKTGEGDLADYGGMSGGGVWVTMPRVTVDGVFEVPHAMLAGVNFCQTVKTKSESSIIAHGPRSLEGVVSQLSGAS